MTRVLIVDNRPAFRQHMRQLLATAGLTVVGEAADVPTAEEQVGRLQPDLVVMDVMLPGVNGLAGTPRLKAIAPALRVILVSAHRDQAHLFQSAAQEAGAEAFVSKDALDLDVVRAWGCADAVNGAPAPVESARREESKSVQSGTKGGMR